MLVTFLRCLLTFGTVHRVQHKNFRPFNVLDPLLESFKRSRNSRIRSGQSKTGDWTFQRVITFQKHSALKPFIVPARSLPFRTRNSWPGTLDGSRRRHSGLGSVKVNV